VGWTKRGRIFEPAGQARWIGTHAALPIVDPVGDGYRVFFSSRDEHGRSHIGYGHLTMDGPMPTLDRISPEAVLRPGPRGAFDDAGVTSACLVHHSGRSLLYYTGWSRGVSVPFYLHIGVAISEKGTEYRRMSLAPLLDRSAVDPYLTASPWIIVEGSLWRMWYVSGTGWESVDGQIRHNYHIRYAESRDGLIWTRTGVVCIDYAVGEFAFGRPCVIFDGARRRYRMWYSVRGDTYRLGYAESHDGIVWERQDRDVGLSPSSEGWDSQMLTYPMVFDDRGTLHMLYNGNDYGRTGIGMATQS
jgi:hypothetical protein